MKTSSIYLLIGILIFVAGTFTWQYILHLQLKEEPLSCTGEQYVSNTCPLGQGCYYSPSSLKEYSSNSQDPEVNQAVKTIIDFKSGSSLKPGVGTCTPWLNLLFKLNLEK